MSSFDSTRFARSAEDILNNLTECSNTTDKELSVLLEALPDLTASVNQAIETIASIMQNTGESIEVQERASALGNQLISTLDVIETTTRDLTRDTGVSGSTSPDKKDTDSKLRSLLDDMTAIITEVLQRE